jgi:hypothetical protein
VFAKREVRCINPNCGVLNRVPRYSVRRVPQCGKCHWKLPEHGAIRIFRSTYSVPRVIWLAIPVVGLIIWGVQDATTMRADACVGRPQPRQGIYKWYGRSWGNDVAAFTIKTAAGSNYFVKLVDLSGRPARAYFVRGGSTISYKVPLGTFVLKYASGKSWCSETELFGPDTGTNQADGFLDFDRQVTEDATGITTSTSDIAVELILQSGGNLRTHAIPRSQF